MYRRTQYILSFSHANLNIFVLLTFSANFIVYFSADDL